VPASARFPAHYLSHRLPSFSMVDSPPAAVAEEVLPRLRHCPSTPVTARLHVTCPGPGNTRFIYCRLATSLRSLAIILSYLPLYYSTILTSTFATVSTDIPSYEAIHGRMPLQYYRSNNFRYVSHTGFHELPLFDASRYARDIIQLWEH